MKHSKTIIFSFAALLFTVRISAQQQEVKVTERLSDEETEKQVRSR
jgi:hypothetical protein